MFDIIPARDFAKGSTWTLLSVEVLYSKNEIAIYEGNYEQAFYSETIGLDDTASFEFAKSGIYTIKYNFDTGIAQTIQWYLDNEEWWKNILSGEYQNYFQKMYVEKGRVE